MSSEREFHGHMTMADGTHVALTKAEAGEIWTRVEAAKAARYALMPDSMTAITMLQDALTRLKDEGWREGCYCPKDGTEFAVMQFGSTGIFEAFYSGKWPDGYVISCDFNCHPDGLLWKPIAALSDLERTKMDQCMKVDKVLAERELRAFSAMDATP